MSLWKNLSETEINHMISFYTAIRGLQERVLKKDAFDIMQRKCPEDYTDKDKQFFDKYSNKKIWIYNYNNAQDEDEWFILEDDNYQLNLNCFEDLPKETHHVD